MRPAAKATKKQSERVYAEGEAKHCPDWEAKECATILDCESTCEVFMQRMIKTYDYQKVWQEAPAGTSGKGSPLNIYCYGTRINGGALDAGHNEAEKTFFKRFFESHLDPGRWSTASEIPNQDTIPNTKASATGGGKACIKDDPKCQAYVKALEPRDFAQTHIRTFVEEQQTLEIRGTDVPLITYPDAAGAKIVDYLVKKEYKTSLVPIAINGIKTSGGCHKCEDVKGPAPKCDSKAAQESQKLCQSYEFDGSRKPTQSKCCFGQK